MICLAIVVLTDSVLTKDDRTNGKPKGFVSRLLSGAAWLKRLKRKLGSISNEMCEQIDGVPVVSDNSISHTNVDSKRGTEKSNKQFKNKTSDSSLPQILKRIGNFGKSSRSEST